MNFIYFIHVRCWNIFAIYVTSFIHVIHVIQWKSFQVMSWKEEWGPVW